MVNAIVAVTLMKLFFAFTSILISAVIISPILYLCISRYKIAIFMGILWIVAGLNVGLFWFSALINVVMFPIGFMKFVEKIYTGKYNWSKKINWDSDKVKKVYLSIVAISIATSLVGLTTQHTSDPVLLLILVQLSLSVLILALLIKISIRNVRKQRIDATTR